MLLMKRKEYYYSAQLEERRGMGRRGTREGEEGHGGGEEGNQTVKTLIIVNGYYLFIMLIN